jgi:hypothetical protein
VNWLQQITMEHFLQSPVFLDVLVYYLDGFDLLVLGCASRNLQTNLTWNLIAGGKEQFLAKHFKLRPFLGALKIEKMKIKKNTISSILPLRRAPTILVEAHRDACDPAFHETLVVDSSVPLVLHDTVSKRSKPVPVTVIAEMQQKYGKITSYRHDPTADYLFFTTRHFTDDGAQHEVVWRRMSEISFECDVIYECLGRLELDPNKTNFPAGIDFVHKGDDHYLIGENYMEFVIIDLSTLKPMDSPNFIAEFGRGVRCDVLEDSTLLVYQSHGNNKMVPRRYSIPDFTFLGEVPYREVSFYHPLVLYDEILYYFERGVIYDFLTAKELMVIQVLDPTKYIPHPSELLAVDRNCVLWRDHDGEFYVVDRKTSKTKEIVSGKWSKKQYYRSFFTGVSIVWYDIDHYVLHIITPLNDPNSAKETAAKKKKGKFNFKELF